MANDFKRGIRVYLDSSDYGKGIDQMVASTKKYEKELEDLTAESKRMTSAGETTGKAWDDNQKKLKMYGDQVKKSQAIEADYRAKLDQTKKVLENLSGSTYNELIAVQKVLQKEVKKGSNTVEEQSKKLEQLQRVNGQVTLSYREMHSSIGAGSKGVSGFIENMSLMPGIVGYAGNSLLGFGSMIKTFLLSPTMIAITAIVGLVSGLFYLAKNSMEFGKSLSNLSALTGAVGKDLDYLKEKAKSLAKDYGKSAVEIVEAMKLVGSAKPELLSNVGALSDVTRSVLTLSKATGMDLTESTKNVTTIMNQFGLSALESDRTVNVLAAGSKFGAVEVDYLGESISKVGTIAKSAGMSLEQTTAMMELFGEKGVKAETAGTGFKGVLVKLQADTKNYTNGMFDLNKAIENNQSISGNNIALQKKFGTEFFGLAQILFQNADRFHELTKQVTGTNVALEQMTIASDNLSGDMDKMKSSWGSFMLSLEDGKGPIANVFRYLAQFITNALGGLALLSKSGAQKDADAITHSVELRIEAMKKLVVQQKDQEGFLNKNIASAKRIYQNDQKYIEQLKAEIVVNNQLGGAVKEQNKDKEIQISKLDKDVKKQIAYVNALGGLRSALKLSKASQMPGEKVDLTTPTNQKKEDAAAKKALKNNLDNLDAELSAEKNLLKQSRLDGKKDEETYNSELLDLEIKYLGMKRDLYKKGSKEYNEFDGQIKDAQIAKQKTENEANLKVIEDSFKSISDVTTQYEQTERDRLQGELDNRTISQQDYNSQIYDLEITLAEARLQNATDYAELIRDATFNSAADKKKAVDAANTAVTAANGVLLKARKSGTKDELGEEKKRLEEIARMRQTLGLDQEKLSYMKSLKALKAHLNEEKIAVKDQQEYIAAFKKQKAVEYAQIAVQITNAIGAANQASNQAEVDSLEAQKQKELTLAGDNAEAIQAVNEKFAQKELDLKKKQADANMAIGIAQAIAAGALGIANIWAVHGVNPILAGIITALEVVTVGMQVSSIISQRNAIMATTLSGSGGSGTSGSTGARVVTQAADGRWDVIGADDGKVYRNVPYRGVARTGIVTSPTLMGERGDELVVDNPTLRNIRMNAPGVLDVIRRNRVSQRASGNYSAIGDSGDGGDNTNKATTDSNAVIAANISVMSRLGQLIQYLIDNGIDAFVILSQLEKQQALRDKSVKKGSLKG